MSIAPAVTETRYLLAGTDTGPFATVFPFEALADLRVYLETGDGPLQLALNIDYTVAATAPLSAGGEVTLNAALVPVAGWPVAATLTLQRRTSDGQPSVFGEMQGFSPQASEAALDHVARQVQDLRPQLARALSSPVGEPGYILPTLIARQGAVLAFDDITGAPSAIRPRIVGELSVIDYGDIMPIVDPTGVEDAWQAIMDAEASAADGAVIRLPAGIIRITKKIVSTRQRPAIVGAGKTQTILRYDGADTDTDIMVIGDGVNPVSGAFLSDFAIHSDTVMTSGAGLHLRLVGRSLIDVDLQGQDRYQAIGNTLWHGLWADQVDQVRVTSREVFAQQDGVRVNGTLGVDGHKADLYLENIGKIGACAVAVHMAGAFGGLYLNNLGMIGNGKHLLIDQAGVAEANREVFINGGAIDVTTSGPGVHINDPGGLLVQVTGTWIASSQSDGFYVQQCGGRIQLAGVRLFNCGRDGLRCDDALTQVNIVGCQIHNNTGWGINPNVANNNVTWSGVLVRDNTAGNINGAHPPVIALNFSFSQTTRLQADVFAVDPNFYNQLQSNNPTTSYDANDFVVYDRADNELQVFIGGNLVAKYLAGGLFVPGVWNAQRLTIGAWHIWDDGAGHLRANANDPANATDGTILA